MKTYIVQCVDIERDTVRIAQEEVQAKNRDDACLIFAKQHTLYIGHAKKRGILMVWREGSHNLCVMSYNK